MTIFGQPLKDFFLANCFLDPDAPENALLRKEILEARESLQSCLTNSIAHYTDILSAVAAFIAFCYIIKAGYMMFTAFGDEAKYAAAKKTLQYAIIGFAIAVLSRFIIHFFIALLGYNG
ncbi:MAG: hypothetical protein AAB669_00460 [Patescibacteria group bacterium]